MFSLSAATHLRAAKYPASFNLGTQVMAKQKNHREQTDLNIMANSKCLEIKAKNLRILRSQDNI